MDALEVAIAYVMPLSVLAYAPLQAYMLWRRRGRSRGLEYAVAIPMVLVIAYSIFGLLAGSSLWPLVLLFTAPLACVALLLIRLVRIVLDWRRGRAVNVS
jgi:hypothetical protein